MNEKTTTRDYYLFLLGSFLHHSLDQDGYLTTEEIARLIVENRGPEDAVLIAKWIEKQTINETH